MSASDLHAGLRDGVRAVQEIGFIYLDDGDRMFRIAASAYAMMLNSCRTSSAGDVVMQYPSLFCFYDSAEKAKASIVQAHAKLN